MKSCPALPCRPALLRFFVAGCALLALTPGAALANFKYIPPGQSDAGTAPAAPVNSGPLPGADLDETVPAHRHKARPVSHTSKASGGEVISGFGNQVPLVMALREIVPSSYQFAYADGLKVNLGTLVNWKGGRPWRDVMHSVIAPLGLTATERNATVYIDRSDAAGSTGH